MKDIEPKNEKGYFHGYQQWYDCDKKLWVRGVFKNDDEIGYLEDHSNQETYFYIK